MNSSELLSSNRKLLSSASEIDHIVDEVKS